ncbi:MAG TPA: tetratricopeptide repeat protein [Vicinamibacterales bacterium]|nr:tetratricopeptide repeat protein [Vicinamibacterales bacterium]
MAIGLAIVAAPASAQSGQIKGKVVDAQNAPVDGATILIENLDKGSKPLTTKTNKKGEYIQVGLYPGKYRITASKGDLNITKETDIHLDMLTLDLKLEPGGGGGRGGTKEDAAKAKAKAEAMNKTFTEGVDLSNQGKHEEAIAKFQEVIAMVPACAECYANIGTVQGQAKKYEEAEAAYKKAIELKPDFGEAYNGLANVYNSEKKFDLAAEASKKAMDLASAAPAGTAGTAGGGGGGGSASASFNQGVILWNAGKIPEAKAQFENAVKADPNLADAQYWLGMALLNGGNTAEAKPKFEAYLKLAPTGQYADTAKNIVASIK